MKITDTIKAFSTINGIWCEVTTIRTIKINRVGATTTTTKVVTRKMTRKQLEAQEREQERREAQIYFHGKV